MRHLRTSGNCGGETIWESCRFDCRLHLPRGLTSVIRQAQGDPESSSLWQCSSKVVFRVVSLVFRCSPLFPGRKRDFHKSDWVVPLTLALSPNPRNVLVGEGTNRWNADPGWQQRLLPLHECPIPDFLSGWRVEGASSLFLKHQLIIAFTGLAGSTPVRRWSRPWYL